MQQKKGRSMLIAGIDKRMSGECLGCRQSAAQQSARVRMRSDGARRGQERWRENCRRIGDGRRSKRKGGQSRARNAVTNDGEGCR